MNDIVCGDCRVALARMEAGSVDCYLQARAGCAILEVRENEDEAFSLYPPEYKAR